VRDTALVKVFEAFNQLSEVGSDQFVIDIGVVVHDEIEEISIGSEFHDGVRHLLGGSLRESFSFVFDVMSSDNVGVVDKRKAGLVLEIGVGLVSSKTKDFHGIVLAVNFGVD